MIDLKELQKRVYQNKVNKWFNVTDVNMEFCLIQEELSEAYRAYRKKLPDLWEEIADVVIYLLGLCEIMNINLEDELLKKIDKNEKRIYKEINWVITKIDP